MNVAFIGGGKMGEAILANLVSSGALAADELCVADVSAERRAALAAVHGVAVTADNLEAVRFGEIVFLAVKPQDLDGVLDGIAGAAGADRLFLSIAAGKRLAGIGARLRTARVVRVMPNVAALVSASMSVFCRGGGLSDADAGTVRALLETFGRAIELPEEQFDAVTAVSGSGPAFFAYFLDCLAAAGEAEGIARAEALALATQTMLGTARLLVEKDMAPGELIAAVSSPRGTTVAGRAVLEDGALRAIVRRTVEAAARRSRELSGS